VNAVDEALADLRREIDAVDAELARLFERRLDAAQRIGRLKAAAGLPVTDAAREAAVLAAARARVSPANAASFEKLTRLLMQISKERQQELLAATGEHLEYSKLKW